MIVLSYRIEYGPAITPQYQTKPKRRARHRVLTALWLLIFVLLVKQCFPSGVQTLRQLLLPASHSITQQALDQLVMEVRDGESFGQAFTAFCQQIIAHDQAVSG